MTMKLFLAIGLLGLAITFASACTGPATDDGTDYECDSHAKTWFQGEDDISADWATTHEWQSARPGIVTADNVETQCKGRQTTCFNVIDNGIGWNSEAEDNGGCNCGYERFSTARVVSKKKYGPGFYELKARTGRRNEPSPFHVALWLQGDKSEIDVVEFVNNNVAKEGKKDYFTNYHCFDKEDEDGSQTDSFMQPIQEVDSWADIDSSVTQPWHTYGVNWVGEKIDFYLDGKKIRSASASCLLGESMTVVLGHETNEDFGGINDAANWEKPEYSNKVKTATLEVSYLKYWKTKKTATTNAPTTVAVTLPPQCDILKQFPAGGGKRHAYQGKNYGTPEKGLSGPQCAAKCFSLPRCTYWILHATKGCILKHWGLSRKKVYSDAFEMHGLCEPVLEPTCQMLGVAGSGDGYRGKRLRVNAAEASTARSPGACSQMCNSTQDCVYWVVHNAKGCYMFSKTKGPLKSGWKPKGYRAHGVCKNYQPGN